MPAVTDDPTNTGRTANNDEKHSHWQFCVLSRHLGERAHFRGIVTFLVNDVAVVSAKPRHDFVMSPAEPSRHLPIPGGRVGNDRHGWMSARSSGEHDAARPLQ